MRRSMAEGPGDRTVAADAGFGGLLRAHRQRALLSQEQLAERSGVSTRTIRELEKGRVRRPQGESVRRLADALRLAGPSLERFASAAHASPSASPSTAEVVPHQLPPDVADFVGRDESALLLR